MHIDSEEHGTALRTRLRVEGDDGMPRRAFVKLTPTRPAERFFNRFMGLARNEAEIYRLLGEELGDVMPRGYGTAFDPRNGRAVVVMEDLNEKGTHFVPMAAGATVEQSLAVATTLGNLHRRFWTSERLLTGDLAAFSPAASRTFTVGPHSWHLLRTIPRSYNDVVPTDFREQAAMLIRNRWAITRLMLAYPHTLIHGDTHLGNIGFVGDRPILFDWQVASCGPAVKDLSYFACTSIDVDVRRVIDRQLVDAYVESLNADGQVRLSVEEAWDAYRLFAFTAYIAAGVTAVFGRRLQGEAPTRAGLRRAVEGVRDLNSFDMLADRI